MRKICLLLAVLVSLAISGLANTNSLAVLVHFENVGAGQVLKVYQNMADVELDIAPEIQNIDSKITFQAKPGMSNEEICTGLKNALEEQAGIIITKTDDKHAKAALKSKQTEKPADH